MAQNNDRIYAENNKINTIATSKELSPNSILGNLEAKSFNGTGTTSMIVDFVKMALYVSTSCPPFMAHAASTT